MAIVPVLRQAGSVHRPGAVMFATIYFDFGYEVMKTINSVKTTHSPTLSAASVHVAATTSATAGTHADASSSAPPGPPSELAGPARRTDKLPSWVALPPAHLPDKRLAVDENTTLLDLLNLIRRSNPEANKHFFSCEMRSGTPHLSLVKREMVAARSQANWKVAMLRVVANTRRCYKLTSAMEMALNRLEARINHTHSPLEKGVFAAVGQVLIGSSQQSRETSRMPADCMMKLISVLDQLSAADDGADASLIGEVLQDAKDRFLRHQLSIDEAEDFFAASSQRFSDDLPALKTLTDSLVEDMHKLKSPVALSRRLQEDFQPGMLSYISELRATAPILTLPRDQRRALETLLHDASVRAETGLTTVDEARTFFTNVEPYCGGYGWTVASDKAKQWLAALASSGEINSGDGGSTQSAALGGDAGASGSAASASAQYHDPAIERFFYTQMHENLYGRAVETFLARALRDTPPERMKASVTELGRALAAKFEPYPDGPRTAASFQDLVNRDDRCWYHQVARITAFLNERDPHKALQDALLAPIETGDDCMGVAYLAFMVIRYLARLDTELSTWAVTATNFYVNQIDPIKSKIVPIDGPGNTGRQVRHGGLMLHYQPAPAMEQGNPVHTQFLDQVKPDLHNPSLALKTALEHGVPYATGVSGVVSWMTHVVVGLQQNGYQIDPADIAAAAHLYLAEGGGHSLHEGILAMVLAAKHLGIEPGGIGTQEKDQRFVSDYKEFFGYLFQDEPELLKALENKVWGQVIAYHREHSHPDPVDDAGAAGDDNST